MHNLLLVKSNLPDTANIHIISLKNDLLSEK